MRRHWQQIPIISEYSTLLFVGDEDSLQERELIHEIQVSTFVKGLRDNHGAEREYCKVGASWATLSSAFICWKGTSLAIAALQSMSSNSLANHIPQSTSTSSHAHGERYYYSHYDQLVLTEDDVHGDALPEPLEKHRKSALGWWCWVLAVRILQQSLSAFTNVETCRRKHAGLSCNLVFYHLHKPKYCNHWWLLPRKLAGG